MLERHEEHQRGWIVQLLGKLVVFSLVGKRQPTLKSILHIMLLPSAISKSERRFTS